MKSADENKCQTVIDWCKGKTQKSLCLKQNPISQGPLAKNTSSCKCYLKHRQDSQDILSLLIDRTCASRKLILWQQVTNESFSRVGRQSLPKTRRILNFHLDPIYYKVWYDQDPRAQLRNFLWETKKGMQTKSNKWDQYYLHIGTAATGKGEMC